MSSRGIPREPLLNLHFTAKFLSLFPTVAITVLLGVSSADQM